MGARPVVPRRGAVASQLIEPNVRFHTAGASVRVIALRRIEVGEILWIDYGDAFWAFRDDLDSVSRRLADSGAVAAHLAEWARALAALGTDTVEASLVRRLRGEFPKSDLRLRDGPRATPQVTPPTRLREPTSLSRAREGLDVEPSAADDADAEPADVARVRGQLLAFLEASCSGGSAARDIRIVMSDGAPHYFVAGRCSALDSRRAVAAALGREVGPAPCHACKKNQVDYDQSDFFCGSCDALLRAG